MHFSIPGKFIYCAYLIATQLCVGLPLFSQAQVISTIKFINGKWFNGKGFEEKEMFSVNGFFSNRNSGKTDTVIDLAGAYLIPPFADAHNHNIGTGVEEWDQKAVKQYIQAGVFYVKIQGNLPIDETAKIKLGINRPQGIDVKFAQGNITAPNGHPVTLVHRLHGRGFYKGFKKEQLNNYRYFTIESEQELNEKWPLIVKNRPDFVKVMLCNSDEYELTKHDTAVWYKGIDPALLPVLAQKVHASGLKLSVHINNSADFELALNAGADEIAHMPRMVSGKLYVPISIMNAKQAAKRKVPVITTLAISLFQGDGSIKTEEFPLAKQRQAADLKTLYENGAIIAIGTDNPNDTGIKEVFYLKELGVFDNLILLKMWTEATAKTIFPQRKIGLLKEGYEASFLALEGNPLDDFEHVKKIRLRFKQGLLLGSE